MSSYVHTLVRARNNHIVHKTNFAVAQSYPPQLTVVARQPIESHPFLPANVLPKDNFTCYSSCLLAFSSSSGRLVRQSISEANATPNEMFHFGELISKGRRR